MSPPAPRAHQVARPVRVLVANSASAMGQVWARALRPHEQCGLAAIVDLNGHQAKGLPLRLRHSRLSIAESIGALPDTATDASIDVTPPTAHVLVLGQALTAGLSVLTEKPFTMDLSETAELTWQAAQRGKVLMVSQSRSHQSGAAEFKTAIDELGCIYMLEARFSGSYPGEGLRAELGAAR